MRPRNKRDHDKEARNERKLRYDEKLEHKRLRAKVVEEKERSILHEPHSIIIHRGLIGQHARSLVHDLRALMEPFTAARLSVMKRNNLKDFIVNGAVLGVTHLLVLTRSEHCLTLRMIRSPHGPTLTYRVKEYTLARQVVSSQKRKMHFQGQFQTPPLVVMNGFASSNSKHLQLAQSMFQNMFPTMNVDTLKLASVRRCVLLNYNSEDNTIEWRHYTIRAVPAGLSKSTKKLVQGKVPDLSKYNDIGDFYLNPGQMSESEYEFEQKEVELPQNLTTRGCTSGQQTNIRLYELGPRLTLELVKIEEGVDEGEVLYHSYIKKNAKELMQLRKELPKRRRLKEKMRKNNEYRVVRRLKALSDQRVQVEKEFEEKKEILIRKQKEVTGDNETDDRQAEQTPTEQNQKAVRPRNKRR